MGQLPRGGGGWGSCSRGCSRDNEITTVAYFVCNCVSLTAVLYTVAWDINGHHGDTITQDGKAIYSTETSWGGVSFCGLLLG